MKRALPFIAAALLVLGCALPWEQAPPAPPGAAVPPAAQPPELVVLEGNQTLANNSTSTEPPPYEENYTEPVEEDPFANLTLRSVSDGIGDGQFRLLDQSAFPLEIHVISAGHADSVLISRGDFHLLLDAGDAARVKAYLKRLGIRELSAVAATRDYPGAVAGLGEILDGFEVGEFWENGVPASSPAYSALLSKVQEMKITVKRPEAGDSLGLWGANITVLNPQRQRMLGNPDTDAIVLKVSQGSFCALLLNPTVQERENAILSLGESLRCGVIVYYRHGEGRPGPSLLLDAAEPADVIISVGPNSDGLPSPTTITRLGLSGSRVWRTDLNGTIVVKYDGFAPYSVAAVANSSAG